MDQVPARKRNSNHSSSTALVSLAAPETQPEVVDEFIDAKASAQATRAANARQVSGRRRFVDPTTCERDYSRDEVEFMQAMQDYKKSSGRMFPTWSEVLEVLINLGYQKEMQELNGQVPSATDDGRERAKGA